jgi:hypothetical protein
MAIINGQSVEVSTARDMAEKVKDKKALAAKIDGNVVDLGTPVVKIAILTLFILIQKKERTYSGILLRIF